MYVLNILISVSNGPKKIRMNLNRHSQSARYKLINKNETDKLRQGDKFINGLHSFLKRQRPFPTQKSSDDTDIRIS